MIFGQEAPLTWKWFSWSFCIRSNWNLQMLIFEEKGKPESPEKNLSEQSKEPATNLTHWCPWVLNRTRRWKASTSTTTPSLLSIARWWRKLMTLKLHEFVGCYKRTANLALLFNWHFIDKSILFTACLRRYKQNILLWFYECYEFHFHHFSIPILLLELMAIWVYVVC